MSRAFATSSLTVRPLFAVAAVLTTLLLVLGVGGLADHYASAAQVVARAGAAPQRADPTGGVGTGSAGRAGADRLTGGRRRT